jgi:hypothetical protein
MNMTKGQTIILRAALLLVASGLASQSAFAQGFRSKDSGLPDSSHFYMSRLQVQMIDETPIVNHQVNPPGAAGNGGMGANQGIPRTLPRAGFNSYTSNIPTVTTTLPKVNNGVPPKLAPTKSGGVPTGDQGRAGRLGSGGKGSKLAKGASPANINAPPTVQAYAPYKGYNPAAMSGVQTSSNSAGQNSQTNVQGNVLHWARSHH